MTVRTEQRSSRIDEGIGESALRPDGIAKLKGEFEYAQDQGVEGRLWGVTTRSQHPHARILPIDVAPAPANGGVPPAAP